MIHQLHIQNFKSHKETSLEFSEGLNIIVGGTDTGKSAIVQALRWLMINRPTGDTFRSTWGGITSVSVHLMDDDIGIQRKKTDKVNSYGYLFHDVEEEFKAIRSDVPEEIARFLNMNEINLQTQFQSHFLLSKSAGEVASHFNRVAHLDKIDLGIANINKGLRTIQRDIRSYENLYEIKTEELKEFDYLPKLEHRVQALEELEDNQQEFTIDYWEIKNLVGLVEYIDKAIVEKKKVLDSKQLLDRVLQRVELINQMNNSCKEIRDLVLAIEMCDEQIDREQRIVNKKEQELLSQLAKGKVCPLCNQIIK